MLAFTFVLNNKLDAGDRETAKLQKKLEAALKDIDRLEKEGEASRKREKKLVEDLKKRDKRVTRELESLDKKVSALAKLQIDAIEEQNSQLQAWVKKQIGIPPRGILDAERPGLREARKSVATWVSFWIRNARYVHEANYHGRR